MSLQKIPETWPLLFFPLVSITILMSALAATPLALLVGLRKINLALLDSEMESIGLRSSCPALQTFLKATLAHSTNHFVILSLIKGYYYSDTDSLKKQMMSL
jgi:hypothetical protein